MKTIDLQWVTKPEVTIIPNSIIDRYLLEANGLQLQVYLYIIRHSSAGSPVHISDIADYFNETEREISRAIAFWEARDVFSCCASKQSPVQSSPKEAAAAVSDASVKSIAAEDMDAYKNSQEFKELSFVAETYMGKPLRSNDLNILLFIKYNLNFSNQLVEYLLEYCAELGKKSFQYVQTVACSWSEQGITTPEEAKAGGLMRNQRVYSVMNELGKKSEPTRVELEHINRWYDQYGFDTDVILEACRRTVLATDKHRFSYAEKILSSWLAAGVHHTTDISRVDASYQSQKKQSASTARKAPAYVANNPFLQHQQSNVDYDALEKELLQN